jgi:esterase
MQLHFESFGDANQPPLLILHGFFASSRNWRQMARQLSNHFHVTVLDLRNHGSSPHDPVLDYPAMAADVLQFIDQQSYTKVSLLGHSMGGKAAIWFALHYPERVLKLLVADISPVTYHHDFTQTIQSLKNLPLDQISNRRQAEEQLSEAIPELSYRQFLLQNLQLEDGRLRWRVNLDIFAQAAPNIVAFPFSDLTFTGDCLFLMGGDSRYLDESAISRCCPTAKIQTIENVGHWLHVEKPQEFYQRSLTFLIN